MTAPYAEEMPHGAQKDTENAMGASDYLIRSIEIKEER
jgi:hypothetical protein